jgi:hypothetical protein
MADFWGCRRLRVQATRPCARRAALELLKANVRPLDIMTRPAFENAITVVMALGGSTNAVRLHRLAQGAEPAYCGCASAHGPQARACGWHVRAWTWEDVKSRDCGHDTAAAACKATSCVWQRCVHEGAGIGEGEG